MRFSSAQQLRISSFHYLGEWMFWLECWGKLYILFWELNVTKSDTFVIDLLNFNCSVSSSNFFVFSVFMLVYSFIIIGHVPENWVQNISREMLENNEQLKKKTPDYQTWGIQMHAFGTNGCLFNKLRVRCKVKKELPCFPVMSCERNELSRKMSCFSRVNNMSQKVREHTRTCLWVKS